MKPKQSALWKALQEWADVTTAHGFFDFFNAKSIFAMIIWFFLVAVSLTLMTYQLYSVISDYSRGLWASNVQDTPTDGIQMPSIVICNVNRIRLSKATEYNLTNDMIHYIFMNMDTQYQIQLPVANLSAVEEAFVEWRMANNFSYMDIFDNFAHTFDDMFIYSDQYLFNLRPVDSLDYGRCYCYDANKTSTVTGAQGGITIVLDAQGWDYVPNYIHNHLYEGIAINIAYNCRVEIGQWIVLEPATRISIGMQMYENTLQEEEKTAFNPFSFLATQPPCLRNPQLMFSNESEGLYTVETCMKECEWLRPVRECNCIPYMRNDHYRTCEVDELSNCTGINSDINISISPEIETEISECRSTCQQACFDQYVDVQTSMTKAPSQAQANSNLIDMLMLMKSKYARLEDMIMLEIYFNSLSIKSVQLFEVMTLDNLISNAGGLIGLWAGMSFLTVFQAIDYFIKFLHSLSRKKSDTKVKPSMKPDMKSDIFQYDIYDINNIDNYAIRE